MSEKRGNKNTIKNNIRVSKDKKTITLKLDNVVEILQGIHIKKIQESLISII